MYVEAAEIGQRPALMTAARRFAPQGARLFADLLAKAVFADSAMVVLDWDDSLGLQPPDAKKPVLAIRVFRRVNDFEVNNLLKVTVILDVEDLFGTDFITAEVMQDVVKDIEDKAEAAIALRKEAA